MHFVPIHHRRSAARLACALIAGFVLAANGPAASAGNSARHTHFPLHPKRRILQEAVLPELGLLSELMPDEGQIYQLKLARQGEEIIDVTYRVGDTYLLGALDKLNAYLRDSHNGEVKTYDPRTFDVLHTMLAKLDRPGSIIEVLSGYRTKETNDALRASGTSNAAEHSQHIEATALDIRVPGIPAADLRDAALSLGAGGVGYYPKGQFIHVDTGNIRKWTYVPHHGRHAARRAHRHRRK
jgi:uncharacterized protein YcbK (DUF882 family)